LTTLLGNLIKTLMLTLAKSVQLNLLFLFTKIGEKRICLRKWSHKRLKENLMTLRLLRSWLGITSKLKHTKMQF